MEETARDQMSSAIVGWMKSLNDYPGWKEWKREQIGRTLYFDDQFMIPDEEPIKEFHFSKELEMQHDIIIQYLGLQQAINLLKDCEYYFRRYPFRGLPVTRFDHITNICEMYFGRIYQIKGLLKNYLNTVNSIMPDYQLDIGGFIKTFNKEFNQELRERNIVHHHRRFEDIAIDRIFLTESIMTIKAESGWKRERIKAYRKLANDWVLRVRLRSMKMDEFLEAVALVSIKNCSFLSSLYTTKS